VPSISTAIRRMGGVTTNDFSICVDQSCRVGARKTESQGHFRPSDVLTCKSNFSGEQLAGTGGQQ
jgi:hypothetical protein